MIISHKHRFIFFAVPKTATHAIRMALQSSVGPDDWQQQMLFGRQALPISAIAKLGHGHISARQIRTHLTQDIWDSYFKFGFVRNPYDRFVSTCFFLMSKDKNFTAEANGSMKRLLSTAVFRRRILVRPQNELLTDEAGDLALDYVGRYETLQDSFDEICKSIGIPNVQLSRKNRSEHAAFTAYYDDELSRIVTEFYSADLRLFSYDRRTALGLD